MKAILLTVLMSLSNASFGCHCLHFTLYDEENCCYRPGVYQYEPAGYNYDPGSYYFNPGYYYFKPSFYASKGYRHRHHRHWHHRHHRHVG